MAENWQLKAVLMANAEGMLKTLKTVNQATRTTRKYLLDVGSAGANLAAQVGMPLGLISAALGAFSIAGIKQAVSNFAALGDQTVKTAQRIGISTDEYQKLQYIAGQSGVSVEGLTSSMGRLNKNIAEAASGGNKDLAALFRKAGIATRDANGQLRSSSDLLPEVAALFERNTNAAVQARMGNAIFGKSWQELAPLLQGGKEGIRELTERYQQLGIAVDGTALKAGERFGDQMEDLNHVLRSYGNTVTAKLIPVLSPLVEKTIQWATANREVITTRVSAFIAEMAAEMAKIDWAGIVRSVGSFAAGVRDLVGWMGGARNALIALAIVMNAQAIVATISLIGAVGRLTLSLVTMTATAIPAALTSLSTLGTSMLTAGTAANGLLLVLGKIALLMAAGSIGYSVGTLINDGLINPAVEKLTGRKGETFGGWLHDAINGPAEGSMPLTGAQQVRASGAINITFDGAPPGMRVEQNTSGDIPVNTDVGYRSYAQD